MVTKVLHFSRKDFTAFANLCFREFGDRVLHWTTINEANIFILGGYDYAIIPPGRSSPVGLGTLGCHGGNSTVEPYAAAHNALLAHASVVRLYRNGYQVLFSTLFCILWSIIRCLCQDKGSE